jgi:hypothetical protein
MRHAKLSVLCLSAALAAPPPIAQGTTGPEKMQGFFTPYREDPRGKTWLEPGRSNRESPLR